MLDLRGDRGLAHPLITGTIVNNKMLLQLDCGNPKATVSGTGLTVSLKPLQIANRKNNNNVKALTYICTTVLVVINYIVSTSVA